MHLDDERIQRALHGELDAPARTEVERHVATCESCRSRLAAARREEARIYDLLERLDAPAPVVTAGDVIERTRSRAFPAEAWSHGAARWAAGILAGIVIAGVAYTAPGSPLPRWVASFFGGAPREPRTVTIPVPSTGIAVDPGQHFTVRFAATQDSGVLVVGLTGGHELQVQARRGLAPLTSGAEQLTIENRGTSADWEIDVPIDAPWVEITIGDRRVFLKEGQRANADAPFDAGGRYVIPLREPSGH